MQRPLLPHSNLDKKFFIIEDLRDKVAELATPFATAIGGNVDHFIANQGNLNKLDKDEQIELLELKQEALTKCLDRSKPRWQELLPQMQ